MVSKIVKGISRALNKEFGNGYSIYQNDVLQGLEEPCFFIATLETSKEQFLQSRFYQRMLFDVHYFPKDAGNNRDMQDVADRLLGCLEWITVGSPLHGTNIRWQVEGGILHFFINYNVVRERVSDKSYMEEITADITTEG